MKLKLLAVLFVFAATVLAGHAQSSIMIDGDTPWVVTQEDFDNPAIREAIRDAERDWYKVFGYPPVIFKENTRKAWTGPIVAFGSVENMKHLVDAEVPEGKERHRIFATKIKHNTAIAAVGNDTRGTIYAIYTFCEKVLGIDPMYIFNDSIPERRSEITLSSEMDYTPDAPTFELRGWFINDEELHDGMHRDPLGGNVISMEWSDKIIESLLRCKGNMLIPESSPYPDATVYDLCKRRGVVITHHHIAPLGLNMMDWPKGVPFSFITHKDILIDAWTKAAKAQADKEVAWIIGFRGESDGAFWHSDPAAPEDDAGRAGVIAEAMQTQTDIVRAFDPDATIVAALWNEQGKFFNEGLLKIPEGVCTMFADDGRGFMRDKGDGSDLKPGDGLYYHVMMMMNSQNRTTEAVPPARIYSELQRYVDRGATKYAIINVSGIRPAVMSTQAIMDFLWDAKPALSQAPEESMKDYLVDWYGNRFGEDLGEALAELRLHYYNIPYMRERMPIQGRWRGARAEHLMFYQIQLLQKNYIKLIQKGEDLSSNGRYKNEFAQAIEPLAETEDFFPVLWEKTKQLEAKIPEQDKAFFQAHFTYQVAVHMYSSSALLKLTQAFEQYTKDQDPRTFAKNLEPVLADIENVIEEAHKAEYGQWDTMFMHARLMDIYRTRLQLKENIAKLTDQAYTSQYRGFQNGSFWRSAQDYMDFEEGTFPYFHEHSGRGLEVLENGTYPVKSE
ncbi:MAG: glycosyl hydrolase 115 family protein [Opitutaceae bacterium]